MSNDDCSPALFRPRYSVEESSDAAYEEDLRQLRCVGRKTRAVRIFLLLAFLIVVGMFTRVYLFFAGIRGGRPHGDGRTSLKRNETNTVWNSWRNRLSDRTFGKAESDSHGFFNDISDEEWKKMKHETMLLIDVQDGITDRTSYLLSESGANINSNLWWADNWKVNFTCKSKVQIGGKWLCDPTRIISMSDEKSKNAKHKRRGRNKRNNPEKECLVYISGGRETDFGHHFLDYSLARMIELHSGQVGKDLLPCEIHVFTPYFQEISEPRDGLVFHNWGFRPSIKESMGFAPDGITPIAFKTLQETITELNHSGKISVLALDCEACEWDIYKDILLLEEPKPQQVLMQMHGTPYMANELFLAMQEAGYVIFHREADGEIYDYSWLNLAPSFFNWKT